MVLPQNSFPLSERMTFGNPRLNARRSSTRTTPWPEIARDRFVRGVVDDGQAFQDASVGGAIEHEVHRPHLVGLCGSF
jgi:hypothetical protein